MTAMKTAVLFSGGIDSVVTAGLIQCTGSLGPLIFFNYGQTSASTQLEYVRYWAKEFGTDYLELTFDYSEFLPADEIANMGAFQSGYVPEQPQFRDQLSADAPQSDADSGLWSWVNGRNALFLLMGSIRASYMGCNRLAYGFQLNESDMDENTQPTVRRGNDTNIQLVDRMNGMLHPSFRRPFLITTPLLGMTKTEVTTLGTYLGLNLALTYSCEFFPPCGVCAQCTDSHTALTAAGFSLPACGD